MKHVVPMIIACAIGLFFVWKAMKLQREVITLRNALRESISLSDQSHIRFQLLKSQFDDCHAQVDDCVSILNSCLAKDRSK